MCVTYCSVARNTTDLIEQMVVVEVVEVRYLNIIINTAFYTDY